VRIELHVDRLVLDGIDLGPGDAPRVRAAVERELTRLLGAQRTPFAGGATAHAAAPEIRPVRGERPETTGSRIASSVHAAIAGGGER
jgi:hypothetical protein